jgi:hypothetical protein
MDWNINIFTKINSLVGRNKWFDALVGQEGKYYCFFRSLVFDFLLF